MLIGIDASRALRARRTGTERYALEIIRHLLQLPEAANHQWRLYADTSPAPGLWPASTPGAPCPNVVWQIMPARRLWTHRTLASEVTRHRPDVLFVPAHVIPFVLPPHRLPPSVVTIHDLGYHVFPETHSRQQRLYLKWSTRWSAWAATRLIAVSTATADDLWRLDGADRRKTDVIHEATVPAQPVSSDQIAQIRQRYALARPYALFVGTLQPRKNLIRLVTAYRALVSGQGVGWDLVLAGAPGWLSDPIQRELARVGDGNRVHQLGFVPEADLPALLSGARLFTFPSLYEGFGLPVLEAQTYGVPVMTSNNSSLPEIAGDAALLVDPTDVDAIAAAMLRLSQDEPLRQGLIAAGYVNVKRFSWEKAARETLAVLAQAARIGQR